LKKTEIEINYGMTLGLTLPRWADDDGLKDFSFGTILTFWFHCEPMLGAP
jgi:hypothetical protein